MREKICMAIAWLLPREIAKWAFIRVAVSGCKDNPATQRAIEPLQRWGAVPTICLVAILSSVAVMAQTATMATSGPASYRVVNGTLLNDLKITPGRLDPSATREKLCDPKFHTGDVRNDPNAWTMSDGTVASENKIKAKVYANYGQAQGQGLCKPEKSKKGGQLAGCEVDHLISLELGGVNSEANLWPQPYNRYSGAPGAQAKDIVENTLHKEVCAGKLTLAQAQSRIATDWYAEYVRIQGEKKKGH